MFSLELPENIICVKNMLSKHLILCEMLPFHLTLVVVAVFIRYTALLQVFGIVEAIVDALKSRFDGLPIHRQCYYQSY